MTSECGGQIVSEAVFEQELRQLIREANRAGEDIRGGYYVPLSDGSGVQIEVTAVDR